MQPNLVTHHESFEVLICYTFHCLSISPHLLSPEIVFLFSTEISDDDNSIAQMYQLISQLPQPNRDTLAFLAVHFQRSVVTVYSHLIAPLLVWANSLGMPRQLNHHFNGIIGTNNSL